MATLTCRVCGWSDEVEDEVKAAMIERYEKQFPNMGPPADVCGECVAKLFGKNAIYVLRESQN